MSGMVLARNAAMMPVPQSAHVDVSHVHAHTSDLINYVSLRKLVGIMGSGTSSAAWIQHLLTALSSKMIRISLQILVLLVHVMVSEFVWSWGLSSAHFVWSDTWGSSVDILFLGDFVLQILVLLELIGVLLNLAVLTDHGTWVLSKLVLAEHHGSSFWAAILIVWILSRVCMLLVSKMHRGCLLICHVF